MCNQYTPIVMELEVPDVQIHCHLEELASYLTNRLRKLYHVSKSNNSLSQDSSHPDDHFQSRYVTAGFKPFSYLRSFGRQSEKLTNDYVSYARNVRRIKQQLWVNHRCKDLGLVPAGLRINSPLNTKEVISGHRQSYV